MSYQAGWTSTNKHAKQQMILRSFFFFLISTRHRVEHCRLDIVDNSDCRKHRSTDVVRRTLGKRVALRLIDYIYIYLKLAMIELVFDVSSSSKHILRQRA